MLIFPFLFSCLPPFPSVLPFSSLRRALYQSPFYSLSLTLSLSLLHFIYIYPSSFLIYFSYIFPSTHILTIDHHRSSTRVVLAMGPASLLVSHIIPIDFVENWRCKEIVKDWFRLRLVRVVRGIDGVCIMHVYNIYANNDDDVSSPPGRMMTHNKLAT